MGRAAVDALRKALADKQADVGAQGEAARALEASGAPGPQIDAAVAALNDLKIDEAVIERHLQVAVSDAGLYDYGPSGGDLRSNVLAFWRQHFVDEEQKWDVECPYAPPAILFKAAGLVDDPTVLMAKDEETGRWYRAHHLLEDFCSEKLQKDLSISAEKVAELKHVLATLYLLSAEELGAKIRGYGITAPGTKNAVSDPHPFTLMVQDSIVPSGYLLDCIFGKRYAIADELGVPFAITVDSQVDVTIRERDSRDQVRASVGEVVSVVKELINGHRTWSDVWSSFPHHTTASAEEDE